MFDPDVLNALVRIGTVSSVNENTRTARVVFPDHDDMVSGELNRNEQVRFGLNNG